MRATLGVCHSFTIAHNSKPQERGLHAARETTTPFLTAFRFTAMCMYCTVYCWDPLIHPYAHQSNLASALLYYLVSLQLITIRAPGELVIQTLTISRFIQQNGSQSCHTQST